MLCLSEYSDISNLINFDSKEFDNCFANSVFPTPVGPVNKKDPTGLSGSDNPAWETFIERVRFSIALSCP